MTVMAPPPIPPLPPAPPPGPLFPWVEANQGLISIVALALALVFALWEMHRANNAARDRREEFRQALLSLLDHWEALIQEGQLAEVESNAFDSVAAMLSAPPAAPTLIHVASLLLVDVKRWPLSLLHSPMEERIAHRQRELATWREKFRKA